MKKISKSTERRLKSQAVVEPIKAPKVEKIEVVVEVIEPENNLPKGIIATGKVVRGKRELKNLEGQFTYLEE